MKKTILDRIEGILGWPIKRALKYFLKPGSAEYNYARSLAIYLNEKHYKNPDWEPFDDLMGVLTQIDNMISGLIRDEFDKEETQRKDMYNE
ncbi:unnamed protein product [marine sediment metagenome]|uniref:Uncharacterized protein n=1 Tax=marine sediment metagenome TaxID=412755 RepID=X0YU49_9ZZZZ